MASLCGFERKAVREPPRHVGCHRRPRKPPGNWGLRHKPPVSSGAVGQDVGRRGGARSPRPCSSGSTSRWVTDSAFTGPPRRRRGAGTRPSGAASSA